MATTDTKSKHAPRSPAPIDVEVGARIRRMRTMHPKGKMSQERLGDLVGVTFQQIQKYEKGTNRIGISRLVSIADALEVDASQIVEGLSEHGSRPSTMAEMFHNTNQAYAMSEALSKLTVKVQNTLVEHARALASEHDSLTVVIEDAPVSIGYHHIEPVERHTKNIKGLTVAEHNKMTRAAKRRVKALG